MKMTVNRSVTINLDNDDCDALMKARFILEDMLDGISDLEDNDIVLIQYGDGLFKHERKDVAKAFIALDNLI